MKTGTGRRAAAGMLLVLLTAAAAAALSGFTEWQRSDISYELETLLMRRTIIMQRYIFGSEKDEGELFTGLSEIETYPALSEDFRSAAGCAGSDCDRVISMKLLEAECAGITRSYGIFYVKLRWYMSGNSGYYTETGVYRVRTSIDAGRQYIAEISDGSK